LLRSTKSAIESRRAWADGAQETEQQVAINPAFQIIISRAPFHELANRFRESVVANVLKRGFLGLAVN
jgi:hypothetical protein